MFSFLLRSAGAIVCESFDEYEQILALCAHCPALARLHDLPAGRPVRIGVVTNAGFEKCAMADHLFASLLARFPHT